MNLIFLSPTPIKQIEIHEINGGHGLNDWDNAREYTRIMSSSDREIDRITMDIYGFLGRIYTRCRLDGNPENNIFSGCYPSKYSTIFIIF